MRTDKSIDVNPNGQLILRDKSLKKIPFDGLEDKTDTVTHLDIQNNKIRTLE
ncbi:MAG: hypothetical protein V2I33_25790 [Kangiellaceae bacterium]|jgi:hypothetical protein|nr:hypothetical protein [Kangiellaceae bacterium]